MHPSIHSFARRRLMHKRTASQTNLQSGDTRLSQMTLPSNISDSDDEWGAGLVEVVEEKQRTGFAKFRRMASIHLFGLRGTLSTKALKKAPPDEENPKLPERAQEDMHLKVLRKKKTVEFIDVDSDGEHIPKVQAIGSRRESTATLGTSASSAVSRDNNRVSVPPSKFSSSDQSGDEPTPPPSREDAEEIVVEPWDSVSQQGDVDDDRDSLVELLANQKREEEEEEERRRRKAERRERRAGEKAILEAGGGELAEGVEGKKKKKSRSKVTGVEGQGTDRSEVSDRKKNWKEGDETWMSDKSDKSKRREERSKIENCDSGDTKATERSNRSDRKEKKGKRSKHSDESKDKSKRREKPSRESSTGDSGVEMASLARDGQSEVSNPRTSAGGDEIQLIRPSELNSRKEKKSKKDPDRSRKDEDGETKRRRSKVE